MRTTTRALVTFWAAVALLPLAAPAGAAQAAAPPGAPLAADSLGDSGVAVARPAARRNVLRLVFPHAPVLPPQVARVPTRQPVHVPGWTAVSAAPQLSVATSPRTVQYAAFRAGTHLSSPSASLQARSFDRQASDWARTLVATARFRTALLSHAPRVALTPAERAELRKLSLDYLNGVWCGWLQGVVLLPAARPGELSNSDQAFTDAVVLRASAGLGLKMLGQWAVYAQSLDALRKDLAGSARLQGMPMDPSSLLAPALLGVALAAPPPTTRAAGGALTKGLVAWYRACYAPPTR